MSTHAPTAVPGLVAVPAVVRPGRPVLAARAARPVRLVRPVVSAGAAPVAAPGSRLVLTRRGRRSLRAAAFAGVTVLLAAGLVLLWLAAAAVVAPGAVAGDGSSGVRSGAAVLESGTSGATSTVTVVVGPGDTLWQIARTHAPDRDPRAVVDQVVALNGLSSSGVQVGDQLLVPSS